MRWHHPEVLWGLLLLVVPIIIHLFHFRRSRRVFFSNVALLRELRRRTQRVRHLRHLLALAARLLAVGALIVAFAGPYFPGEIGKSAHTERITLFLDNSWSMSYSPRHIALFDRARRKALEVLNTLPPHTRVQLLTHRFAAEEDLYLSVDKARERVRQLQLWPIQHSFSEIRRRIRDNLYGITPQQIFFISDFQTTLLTDSPRWSVPVTALPVHAEKFFPNSRVADVSIDVPYVLPMQNVRLHTRIEGRLRQPRDVDVTLKLGDRTYATRQITLEEGRSRHPMAFPIRILPEVPPYGYVEMTSDAFSADDRFYFVLPLARHVQVLYLYGQRPRAAVTTVFEDDSLFVLRSIAPSKWQEELLKDASLVIAAAGPHIPAGIWNRLRKYVDAGGNVLLLADGEKSRDVFMKWGLPYVRQWQKVAETIVPTDHPFFHGVFHRRDEKVAWPQIDRRPVLSRQGGIALLRGRYYRDPFFLLHRRGRGHVFQLVSPIDSVAALVRHALWVPMLIKPALYGREHPVAYPLSPEATLRLPYQGRRLPTFKGIEIITGKERTLKAYRDRQGLRIPLLDLETPGIYRIVSAAAPDSTWAMVAVNLDRKESKLTYLSADQLQKLGFSVIAENATAWQGSLGGRELWPWLLILALTFLLAEMLILRKDAE